jgi:hypothetical protein
MGARDWMLVYAARDVQPVLASSAPVLDRDATRVLVRRLYPAYRAEVADGTLGPGDVEASVISVSVGPVRTLCTLTPCRVTSASRASLGPGSDRRQGRGGERHAGRFGSG